MKFQLLKNIFSSFNTGIFTIPNFFLIGTTIVSQKLILILIAYFFTGIQYNTFNRAYYTASILIIFGTLGFEFAVNRISTTVKTVSFGVLVNVIAAFTVLYFLSDPFTGGYQVLSVFVYSLFACLGGIFSFQHLFQGRMKFYVILMLTNAFLHLLIIPFVSLLDADIFLLLPMVTLIWFIIGYPGFRKYNEGGKKTAGVNQLGSIYKIGLTTFIINSAVSLALVADKYIVNHYFPIGTANAYTFSWGLIAPMFYIGNLIEKLIYGSTSKEPLKVFSKAMVILMLLIAVYSVSLLTLVNYLPGVIPASINAGLFLQILGFMITGYAVYSVINFPVNGYLFKFAETSKQKIIAAAYLVIVVVVPVVFLIVNGGTEITSYRALLMLIWSFIFSLMIFKSVVVFFPVHKSAV